jgi:hypothetical protein
MDKEPDSMVKPDYAPSEIYSSASEPPPVSWFTFSLLILEYQKFNVSSIKIHLHQDNSNFNNEHCPEVKSLSQRKKFRN